MTVVVLSEASDQLEPSASARDLHRSTEAARIAGCRVYHIPPDFHVCETAENALWHIPEQDTETPAVWIGYIPQPERYEAVYEAALRKGLRLLNTPEEHLRAQEFDNAYPRLIGLTPESVVVEGVEECAAAMAQLGPTVFVKGTVQSRKARGWKACVAESVDELEALVSRLLDLEDRTRGRCIVRKLAPLRYARLAPNGFPCGREYRVFLYQGRILGYGYYWQGDDPFRELGTDEQRHVFELAVESASRLDVPYVAIDIGQVEGGDWIVIETGDPQFSGVSETPLLELWHNIASIGADETGERATVQE